jgi:hypothetical protein
LRLWLPGEAAPPATAEPSHREAAPIQITGLAKDIDPVSLCLLADGTILVGLSRTSELRVLAADGRPTAVWTLPMPAEAMCPGPDGSLYVAGERRLARLDAKGAVVGKSELPKPKDGVRFPVGGLAVLGRELFVCARGEGGFEIWRYDLELGGAERILSGLRGCCGRLSIAAGGDALYIAENTLHKVGRYDRQGKLLDKWGSNRRGDPTSFGGCCNPMDICVGIGGDVYTAESEGFIKRFTAGGKFVALVGKPAGMGGCKAVPLAASVDGGKVYMLDVEKKQLRVLAGPKAR